MICINPKNYALTEGKNYDVISEEGNYIFIHNDKNLLRKYYRNLFEEYQPELPLYLNSNASPNFEILINDEVVHTIDNNTESTELNCCGIREVTGIHSFLDNLLNLPSFGDVVRDPENVPLNDIKLAVIDRLIASKMGGHSLIVSIVGEARFNLFEQWANNNENFTVVHTTAVNNNSGNLLNVFLISKV